MSDANEAIKRLGESVEEPLRIKGVYEIYPDSDSGVGGYDSDAAFLIDEYIGYTAKSWYTNGHIPEEEEQELRNSLTGILVQFEYWQDEDEDFEAGYEDGEILFIICNDGGLCGEDQMGKNYPDDVYEKARDAAYKRVGVKYTGYCGPEY
jgi:predicted PP-loop superfamily ATPase